MKRCADALTPTELPITSLHPAEERLIRFIRTLKFGRIHMLEIQNGLPVLAEEVTTKVKFLTS